MLLKWGEGYALGDAVPLEKTVTAAASGGVLGKEDQMTLHGHLLPVVGNHSGGEALCYKILRVGPDGLISFHHG